MRFSCVGEKAPDKDFVQDESLQYIIRLIGGEVPSHQ